VKLSLKLDILGVRTPGAMTPKSNSAEIFAQCT